MPKKYGKLHVLYALIFMAPIIDVIMFYTKDTSSNLLITLSLLLCYEVVRCYQIIVGYGEMDKQLKEKESELIQSRIMTMMGQIRSHFVFNILNAISGMCKYDPEKADKTVVRFARFLRTNINIMQEDNPVRFQSALQHLEDYIALEQVRFGDKIDFFADIMEDNFMLPPLIMQPIVENAIKYGLTPKPQGGTITLTTRREGDYVYLSIEDDGVGYDTSIPSREGSVGLKNVALRLKHMMQGEMQIHSEIGKGTRVEIKIPYEEADECM